MRVKLSDDPDSEVLFPVQVPSHKIRYWKKKKKNIEEKWNEILPIIFGEVQ
jgi:hypothetical protein